MNVSNGGIKVSNTQKTGLRLQKGHGAWEGPFRAAEAEARRKKEADQARQQPAPLCRSDADTATMGQAREQRARNRIQRLNESVCSRKGVLLGRGEA